MFHIKAAILPFARHAFFIKDQGHTIPVLGAPCRPLAHFSSTKRGAPCRYPVFPHHLILMFPNPSIPCLHWRFKYALGTSDHEDTNERQSPSGDIHYDNLDASSCLL